MGRLRSDRGQVIPLLAAGVLVMLLGMTAFVLDVGKAMLVKRQLQAQVDAAVLAGANALPDWLSADSAASAYMSTRNQPGSLQDASSTVTAHCLTGADAPAGCVATTNPDAIQVRASGSVPTSFAGIFGIDSLSVSATATAARYGSTKQLDIALVLDRTLSMQYQISNLVSGVETFLGSLDPAYDQVALIEFPPIYSEGGDGCTRSGWRGPTQCNYYPSADDSGYLVDPLTSDFASGSTLWNHVDALQAVGATAYKQALVVAYNTLMNGTNARPGAKKVIVFETDGAANIVPQSYYQSPTTWTSGYSQYVTGKPGNNPDPDESRKDDIEHPCYSAVSFADSIKTDVTIDTVDFDHSSDSTCYQAPEVQPNGSSTGWRQVRETLPGSTQTQSADQYLRQIAVDTGGDHYLQTDGAKLADTFKQIASTLSTASLVSDGSVS